MLSALACVDGQNLNRGRLKGEQWDDVYAAAERLARTKLFIDDSAGLNMRIIRSRARRLQAEQGLDALFIDYLQLLPSVSARALDRHQEISEISRQLKSLAKELRVPVIVVSQLNRAVESRQNKRSMLSDLRESGSLEQDADIVAFLYRDEYYNKDTEEPHICELNIAKHRNGPVGMVKFYFDKARSQFFELANRE